MALKVLMLRKKLSEKNDALSELRKTAEGFQTREAELEKAIAEASTDEEKKVVEDNIASFEADKEQNEKAQKELTDEISDIEKEIAEVESKAPTATKEENEKRKVNNPMTVRSYKSMSFEQRKNFVERDDIKDFIQRVRQLKGETRAVTGGELNIPDVMLGMIREDVSEYSKLLKYVRLKKVSGKSRQNIAGDIPESVWTEMIANFNEADISFNQIEVDGYKVGNFVSIANSILDDSSDVDLYEEAYDGIIRGHAIALDKAIAYGSGKRMLTGIVTRLNQIEQPSDWGANAPTWTDLHSTNILKLDINSESGVPFFQKLAGALGTISSKYGSDGLFWAMSHKTHMDIAAKALSLTAGGSMVVSVTDKMPVVGGEIVELDFIPDYEIVGGYGSQYLLAERQGSTFKRSEHARFLQDQTVFVGYARYDGKPIKGEGFVAVNYNNTNVTTSVLFQGDSANAELVSLSELTVGGVTLFPTFDSDTLNYRCDVKAHSNKIAVKTVKSDATVVIKNGDTVVENGKNATFTAGENLLTIEVTNGNATKRVYTVVVMDSAT